MHSGRRRILGVIGGLIAAASAPSRAQIRDPRIGFLSPTSLAGTKDRYRALSAAYVDKILRGARSLARAPTG